MKKICKLGILLFACLLAFTSCATTKKASQASLRPVYITNSKKIKLLPLENSQTCIDGLQLLTGTFNDSSFTLLSYTQIDSSIISLALMNDMGTDMGSLIYDGLTVNFESAFLPNQLPGEYIISDIQNAYYSAAELEASYQAAHLTFSVSSVEDPDSQIKEIRRIYDGKKLIEEIEISEKEVYIKNYLRGYSYNLLNYDGE
ncbi:MAG: DUF3261 domain-containing protein [Treponema sp.]|nr:DUF3261 domain-containing protein [Treponema sp.]